MTQYISRVRKDSQRRVLLFSLHNLVPAPWNGVIYEMMDVVGSIENATLVAPASTSDVDCSIWTTCRNATRAASGKVLAQLAVHTASQAPSCEVAGEFEMTFYACQFPHEIREINCIPHWRERTRKACIFILETWASDAERQRTHFRQLDMFDHVFVFNAQSVPLVQRYTRAPVSYLATAADTLLLSASRFARERNVDFLCMGRRNNPVHERMFDICCRDGRFYVFDIWQGMNARQWHEARRQNADMAARSQHFVVWAPQRPRAAGQAPEEALTTRYFEGASSGAVMIGSTPGVPEFADLFSSPEPVVEMPQDPDAVAGFLDRLEADADYLAAVGRANRLDALARHDWAHRWAEILDVMGLGSSPGLDARLGELWRRRLAEAHAWKLPAVSGLVDVPTLVSMPAAGSV